VEAWFHLGFGLQHVHAIREAALKVAEDARGLRVRRARHADIAELAALDLLLPEHQGRSPVFSAGLVPTLAEAEAEWAEALEDDAFASFVAEYDGKLVGAALGCSIEKSSTHYGLSRPDDAGFLGWAVVSPEARGQGAGRALGEEVISWAAAAGYSSVVTDWRATNLLSSRTWPRLGFRSTFLRLHRVTGY
jgi:GNAT superfamily N-acetyltransferase